MLRGLRKEDAWKQRRSIFLAETTTGNLRRLQMTVMSVGPQTYSIFTSRFQLHHWAWQNLIPGCWGTHGRELAMKCGNPPLRRCQQQPTPRSGCQGVGISTAVPAPGITSNAGWQQPAPSNTSHHFCMGTKVEESIVPGPPT